MLGGSGGKYGVEGMAAGIAPKYAAGRLGAAAVGFLDEGVIQGGSEQLASNYGLQRALPNQSLTENIGPNIVLGDFLASPWARRFGGGSAPAAAADAVPDPLTPVATKAAEPNSPLSKAAMAGQAPAAPEVIDPISVQASEIEGAIRDGGLLQTLRDTGDEGAVGDLLGQLAIARNNQADPIVRQHRADGLAATMDQIQLQPVIQPSQAWRDMGLDDSAGSLDQQRDAAPAAEDVGRQWQDLGIEQPVDALSAQKAAFEAGETQVLKAKRCMTSRQG